MRWVRRGAMLMVGGLFSLLFVALATSRPMDGPGDLIDCIVFDDFVRPESHLRSCDEHRARAGEMLGIVAKVLSVGGSIASNVDDLAVKLAAIRAEVGAMAASGRVSAEQLDAAMVRIRAASAAFRAALEIAQAPTS